MLDGARVLTAEGGVGERDGLLWIGVERFWLRHSLSIAMTPYCLSR